MTNRLRRLCLLGIGLLVACEGLAPSGEGVKPAAMVAPDPDLCPEHGVLATVCTRCNPALIPVFQSKGDWCPEHGFPESFCPVCAPERGGRPVAEIAGARDAPADGTQVRLGTRGAAAQAGIEVVPAERSDWVEGIEVVARVTWDATRVAAVSARTPGLVILIRAEVGDPVRRGQALAELRSAHLAGDRSRATAAVQARDVAATEVERKRALLAGGVASERDLLEAERALAAASAELVAVDAELALAGGGEGDSVLLTAPIAGIVTVRHARVGQVVDGPQPLFEIVDPSRMWAELDVPERQLVSVAPGQAVKLRLEALPGEVFEGTIATLSPAVDPATRTALARVELDNPDGRLRANLYGTATILGATAEAVVVVPAAAVQRAGGANLVFVREQVDSFLARRVRVLSRQGDRVRIAGGVQPGDPVVTTGSFLLKTETLKDSIGAGCCEVD
jgi:cobalt-zinc-cadmium efflux system membrane fusion protein